MDERTARLNQAITEGCRPTTAPVGVRLARPGESPPLKTKYPIADIGRRLAVCQGMTAARTLGWAVAFGAADHACPLPRVFMGHVAPDRFLEGTIADAYQEDPACMRRMEASYPRWSAGAYSEIWLAPLARCGFVPDLAVVYGTPAQVLALVQAANFGKGPGIASTSTGRYGCSLWIAGVARLLIEVNRVHVRGRRFVRQVRAGATGFVDEGFDQRVCALDSVVLHHGIQCIEPLLRLLRVVIRIVGHGASYKLNASVPHEADVEYRVLRAAKVRPEAGLRHACTALDRECDSSVPCVAQVPNMKAQAECD